jgi:hypothetical protein
MVVPLKSVPDSPLSLFIPVTNKQKLYSQEDATRSCGIWLWNKGHQVTTKGHMEFFLNEKILI